MREKTTLVTHLTQDIERFTHFADALVGDSKDPDVLWELHAREKRTEELKAKNARDFWAENY